MTAAFDDTDTITPQLDPDETVRAHVRALDARIVVTDRRLAVAEQHRLALDVGFDNVRRIQFDIERRRPATLVIVPEHPSYEAQVLSIPPEQYEAVGAALAFVGQMIADKAPPG